MNIPLPKIKNTLVVEKICTKISAETLYSKLQNTADTCILNSSLNQDSGRYSYIGLNPYMKIQYISGKTIITTDKNIELDENPLNVLDYIFKKYKTPSHPVLPFTGGAIGYLSYDLKNILEILPEKTEKDINIPDLCFVFYKTFLIFDNLNPNKMYFSSLQTDQSTLNNIEFSKKDIIELVNKPEEHSMNNAGTINTEIISNMTKDDYMQAVTNVLEYLKAGDIYQVCLAQRFKTKCTSNPYLLYSKLNQLSPAPFSAFLNFSDLSIISSSPELLIKNVCGILETRPMKGTRPKTNNIQKNAEYIHELEKSEKEKAELSMIVDLERNDLGKVSVPGSIKLKEHRRIEEYSTVYQAISILESKLNKDMGPIDIIKAMFPGGSISGCPKIRAMEIIDELEPNSRGIYTGSLGYIGLDGSIELNIAIRTMILQDDNLYFSVGSGIVVDSDPEKEYQETLDKAKAMIEVLQ